MSDFNSIQEFNTYLSNNLKNVKLNEYFKEIHSKFYSELDISFMEYFLELCNYSEDEFVVEHAKLQEFGVLNNINTSAKINRTLERLKLKNNEHFKVSQLGQPVKQGGFSVKNTYTLTPYAFKLCLIRSYNTTKYSDYYLLLEQVFKNYQEYQIIYQK